MSTHNIQLLCRKSRKKIPKLSPFASWLGTIINSQWLEPPMSRTIYYGSKDVRAIEVRLYPKHTFLDVLNKMFLVHNFWFTVDKLIMLLTNYVLVSSVGITRIVYSCSTATVGKILTVYNKKVDHNGPTHLSSLVIHVRTHDRLPVFEIQSVRYVFI